MRVVDGAVGYVLCGMCSNLCTSCCPLDVCFGGRRNDRILENSVVEKCWRSVVEEFCRRVLMRSGGGVLLLAEGLRKVCFRGSLRKRKCCSNVDS